MATFHGTRTISRDPQSWYPAGFDDADRVNVMLCGAQGTGDRDDTRAIQAAADEVERNGGGVLYFPPRRTFLFSSTVFLGSRTSVIGGGWSTVLKAVPGANWVTNTAGSSAYSTGSFRTLFTNRNWASNTILDTDFLFADFAADLDLASSVQRKALCTMISARNTEFRSLLTRGGGGICSHLHTENSKVHHNTMLDFHSTGIDHYSGFKDAFVGFNYLRQTALSSSNPAIQFTGTNNDNTYNVSDGVVCIGNRVKCQGGFLTSVGGISITATGVFGAGGGGTVNNVHIADNDVDMSGLNAGGVLCYGGGDNWNINTNTVRNVADYNCIFAIPNGYGVLTRVNMKGNRVLDSTRTSGAGRIITVDAVGSTVVDNDVLGCTGTTGTHVTGDGSVLQLGSTQGSTLTAAYGTSGAVTLNGEVSGTWTPVLAFGGASVGITGTFSGTWHRNGSFIDYTGSLSLTSKGSSTGTATITGLPLSVPVSQSGNFRVTGASNFQASVTKDPVLRASTTGLTIVDQVVGGSNLDNTHFANNTNLAFTGRVRVA